MLQETPSGVINAYISQAEYRTMAETLRATPPW